MTFIIKLEDTQISTIQRSLDVALRQGGIQVAGDIVGTWNVLATQIDEQRAKAVADNVRSQEQPPVEPKIV